MRSIKTRVRKLTHRGALIRHLSASWMAPLGYCRGITFVRNFKRAENLKFETRLARLGQGLPYPVQVSGIRPRRGPSGRTKRTVMLSKAKHLLVSQVVLRKKEILRCAQNDRFKIFAPPEEQPD